MLCIIHIRIVQVIGAVLTVECSSVVYFLFLLVYFGMCNIVSCIECRRVHP